MKYLKQIDKPSSFNPNVIVIFATMLLALFHIGTFMQKYYSFYITCIAAVVITMFYFIFNFKHPDIFDAPFLLLCLSAFIIIALGMLLKEESFTEAAGKRLPYVLWPLLYRFSRNKTDRKLRVFLIVLFSVVLAVSVILTLVTLVNDSNAARLLAGKATETERAEYYAKGVGGYGFVFGTVFVAYALLKFGRTINFKAGKIAIIVFIALIGIMTVFASYTTAIILFFVLVFVAAFTSAKKHNWVGFVLLFVGSVLVIVFRNTIFEAFAQLGKTLELPYVENRFTQLLDASSEGSVEGLRRYTLYKKSLDTFFSNILTGGTEIGKHSEIFDLMGTYGIFSIPFIVSQVLIFRQLSKDSAYRAESVYWIFFAYMFIDTVDSIVTVPMIYFVLPFILAYTDKEKEKMALPINYKGVRSVYEKSRRNNPLL